MTSTVPASSDRHKILVVEDHPLTLEGILKILNQFYGEADVTQAHTFVQATALIQHQLPDQDPPRGGTTTSGMELNGVL